MIVYAGGSQVAVRVPPRTNCLLSVHSDTHLRKQSPHSHNAAPPSMAINHQLIAGVVEETFQEVAFIEENLRGKLSVVVIIFPFTERNIVPITAREGVSLMIE
jgi:hypothetical protein